MPVVINPVRLDTNDPRSIEDFVNNRLVQVVEQVIVNQNENSEELKGMVNEMRELFLTAFPDGDPGLHKQAHLLMMKAAAEEAAFWQDMKKKLAQSGVLAVFTGLAIAVTVWLQVWVKGAAK